MSVATAYAHLLAVLRADSDVEQAVNGRIYQGTAPENTERPFVLIQYYDADDVYYIGHDRIAENITVSVRVITEGSSAANALAIYAAVDAAVQGSGPRDNDYGTVHQCVRVNETELVEQVNSRTYRYHGGLYTLLVT